MSNFGDQFAPMQQPSPGDDALTERGRTVSFGDLVAPGDSGRFLLTDPQMSAAMAFWSALGSVVLVRGEITTVERDPIVAQGGADLT